jgi:hypothetical protein
MSAAYEKLERWEVCKPVGKGALRMKNLCSTLPWFETGYGRNLQGEEEGGRGGLVG